MADSSFNVKLNDGVSGPASKAAAALESLLKTLAATQKASENVKAPKLGPAERPRDSAGKFLPGGGAYRTDQPMTLLDRLRAVAVSQISGIEAGAQGKAIGAMVMHLSQTTPAIQKVMGLLAPFGVGFDQIGAAAEAGMGVASRAVSGLGSAAMAAGSAIMSGLVAGILAGVAAVGALVIGIGVATAKFASMAIQVGSFREKNLLSMEVLLKSAEASKRVYAEAVKFAAATPFETAEVVTMFKQLISAGFKEGELKRVATAIGDAAASAGGGQEVISSVTRALGQVRSKGRLQMEEVNQLTDSGAIGLGALYEQIAIAMGTTVDKVPKLIEGGKVKGEAAIEAVIRAIEATRGGTMAKLERTFEGASSTFKSLPFDLFNKAFEDDKGGMAQFQKSVTEILLTLNQAFSPNSEGGKTIVKFLNDFASGLAVVSKLVLAIVQGFTKGLGLDKLVSSTKGLADLDPKNVEQLGRDLSQVGEAAGLAASGIIQMNSAIISAVAYMSQFETTIKVVKVVLVAVGIVAAALAAVLGLVLYGVFMTLAAPIIFLIGIVGAVVAAFWALHSAVSEAVDRIGAIDMASIGANIVQGLINGMTSMFPSLAGAASNLASIVKDGVAGAGGLAINSPSKVMTMFGGYTAEGLSIGMDAGSADVAQSASQMSAAVTQGAARGTNAAGGVGAGIQIGSITITASGGNAEAIKTAILEAFEQVAVEFGAVGA